MDLKNHSFSADDELERLHEELEEEKQRKLRLDKRIDRLEQTIEHLAKLFEDEVTNGDCQKWRTKYEIQADLNWKLEDEIRSLNRRIAEANQLLKDKNRLKRKFKSAGRLSKEEDIVRPYDVKLLEREKMIITGELRNAEHRLDRESERFYKLDAECRQIERDVEMNSYGVVHPIYLHQQQQHHHPHLLHHQPIHRNVTKKLTPIGSSPLSSSNYFIEPNSQRFDDDVNYSSGHHHHSMINGRIHPKKERNRDQRKPTKPTYNNY